MTVESVEAKRARDRAYAASYRARKRAEAAAARAVASDVSDGVMRRAVDASLAAAKWLAPSDGALVVQARAIADLVDTEVDTKVVLRLHSLLSRVLGELGLTPRARIQLEVRSRKIGAAVVEGGDLPSNVSKISVSPRPPRRRR